MSPEDTDCTGNGVEACAVCEMNVGHGGGSAKVRCEERMVSLCCPLCLETFQRDPKPYVAKLMKIERFRELREIAGISQPGIFFEEF